MTPNEHYIEAETLLERAKTNRPAVGDLRYVENTLAAAHVHAELAQVTTPPPEVDYKALLTKYIQHVGECEGIDFLAENYRPGRGEAPYFTDEEWRLLKTEV